MGNTLCGSIVVIAIANAHTQDDAIDSLSLKFLLWFKLSVAVDRNAVMRSWTLLAASGSSYAPDIIHYGSL